MREKLLQECADLLALCEKENRPFTAEERAKFDANKADFSKMSSFPLFVSDVLHQAFVSVDENGTEAAAATAVVMKAGAAPAQPITLDVEGFLPDGPVEDIWSGAAGRVSRGTLRSLELPPRSAAVFVR